MDSLSRFNGLLTPLRRTFRSAICGAVKCGENTLKIQFSTYYNDQKSTDSPVIHRLPDSKPYFYIVFCFYFFKMRSESSSFLWKTFFYRVNSNCVSCLMQSFIYDKEDDEKQFEKNDFSVAMFQCFL